MTPFIGFLRKINSWKDYNRNAGSLSKLDKGRFFELLTKYYLLYHPVYRTLLKRVWLWKEIPPSILAKTGLPFSDQGIDLLAETKYGQLWAIQCKYLQEEQQKISHRKLSTFVSLGAGLSKHISFLLVSTTVDEFADIYKGKSNIGFIKSDEWNKLDKVFFDWLRKHLAGKKIKPKPLKPFPYQQKSIKDALNHFIKENNSRGKLIYPCGAGKSLTGYWIAKALKSTRIIVAVPSLALVKQTLEVYLRETTANGQNVAWLCVCSDEGIGKNDDVTVHTQDIGIPCVTDKKYITAWLKKHKDKKLIVFTTYHSGKVVAEASKEAGVSFDLGIMDEAHKTVGAKEKLFTHLLFDQNIKIRKRIFMTATERRYQGSSEHILSMDDQEVYGNTFGFMSFSEAVGAGILSDYRILTMVVSDAEVRELINKNVYVKPEKGMWNEDMEARAVASLIGLRKAMVEHPIQHAVTFHSSIAKAKSFKQSQSVFSNSFPQFGKPDSYHVTGSMPTSIRSRIVEEFSSSERAIITNAKCLTEGVDVPGIDCVLFADPRKSTVDIVQAVGRALRKKQGNKYGYVLIPVFIDENNPDDFTGSKAFAEVLSTLRSLASNDERIIEYFRDIHENKKPRNEGLINIEIDERLSRFINEEEFINQLELKTWQRLAKLSWRPFEEAREFVRTLNLKGEVEWRNYCHTKNKPFDISSRPDYVYKRNGWIGWGDWLGTGTKATFMREYLPFEKAREFVRKLNLKTHKEWNFYCDSGRKPDSIPVGARSVYKLKGWISWGDWLGTNSTSNRHRTYYSFQEARKLVHDLKFQNQGQWKLYCKSGIRSPEIPSNPNAVYAGKGWINWGDWLGTNRIAPQNRIYLNFYAARKNAISLKLKNRDQWFDYCKSGKKPQNIPTNPNVVYKDKGWVSMGDWLGTGRIAAQQREYHPFEKARQYVQKLKLKNQEEWKQYCKSGKKPETIPTNVRTVYLTNGWISWGDWLGTGKVANQNKNFLSFEAARDFIRKQKLKSQKEWGEFKKSGRKPDNIPANPSKTYVKSGWINWGDWLGTGTIASYNKIYLPFEQARKLVRALKLSNNKDWRRYSHSIKRPENIPANPDKTYKNKGWINWADWLGTNNISNSSKDFLPFHFAREFVRSLKLRNWEDWNQYCKSGKKPPNIPGAPDHYYRNKGWVSMGDWLGTKNIAPSLKEFLSFDEARKFVRGLTLKNNQEWRKYCKSGRKPVNIPAKPERTYQTQGWAGFADWLGKTS